MNIDSVEEILDLLELPPEEFHNTVTLPAKALYKNRHENKINIRAMLGYTNICQNDCLYCGMRASQKIPRYRMSEKDIFLLAQDALQAGIQRIFLIAGEDPAFMGQKLIHLVEELKKMELAVSLACGELNPPDYKALFLAGADEYVMKFEMSQKNIFNRLNPSTNYTKRMDAIKQVQSSGMKLASGGVIDYPGQSLRMLAEDIYLTCQLNVSWVPIIPYLPVPGTPLAEEGGMGNLNLCLRTISILRLLLPDTHINAQQRGKDPQSGLTSLEGNAAALDSGADILFLDLLKDKARTFRVIDQRQPINMDHLEHVSEFTGMPLSFAP